MPRSLPDAKTHAALSRVHVVRPVTVDGVGITYDALGRMVEQNRSGVHTQKVYSPTGFQMQIVSGQTNVYSFSPNPGGGATVWSAPAGTVYYRHADWLGSSRFASTYTRSVFYDGAYAPFGEQYANSGTSDLSFTGMDQDTSSNLYDFPAREYGIQGRWPSPDPAGLLAVDPSNPQSWNRYAYVGNNPLAMSDPTGMEGIPGFFPCADPVSCIVENIIAAIFDLFQFLFSPPPPPQAAPAPPGGYGAGIDPYGTWDEKLPKGVQVFPSPIPGLNSPTDSNCDWCGTDFRNGGHSPNPQLFPGLEYGGFVIRVFVTEYLDNFSKEQNGAVVKQNFPTAQFSPIPIQRPRFSQHDQCLAKKLFPAQAVAQGTEFGITKLLDRVAPGLGGGMEAAGPIGLVGTAAGSVIGCEKELGIGNF